MSQSHDSMIAVIAAHRDGKEIEYRHHSNDSEWKPVQPDDKGFTFMSFEYRIKPVPTKPREWWIAHSPEINPNVSPAYPKKPDWTPVNPLKTEIIHLIEVLPSSGESV